jgi:Protein of unknown function DUF262
MGLIQDVESQRHRVVVEVYSPTWNELLNQYIADDIEIDPIYQRAFRWDNYQQTQFIESLLLNIPTPPIFLAEKKDGKFEVIDGLQRFSTMVKFFAEEIFEAEDVLPSATPNSENNIYAPAVLAEAPILEGLSALSLRTMPETLVRTLRYSRAQVILLKKESSAVAKYNVFTRLNKSGTQLTDQEIRNCSARLLDPEFADSLLDLGKHASVKRAMALSTAEIVSMKAEENILRLLAFSHADLSTKTINDFLDAFMYAASSGKFSFDAKRKKNVELTFDTIAAAFHKGEAFKFYRNGKFSGGFSTNLFDIVGCGIYKNITKVAGWDPSKLKKRILDLHNQSEAIDLTGAGSNTRKKMVGRVQFGHQWFA